MKRNLVSRMTGVFELIRLWRLTGRLKSAKKCFALGLHPKQIAMRQSSPFLRGTDFNLESIPTTLAGHNQDLVRLWNVGFRPNERQEEGVWVIHRHGLSLRMTRGESVFIAAEVFANLEYGIIPSGPVVIVDIGMNVATTSLFFAEKAWVTRVYGFEPNPDAITEANRNLTLNPTLAKKITVNPFGLGATDATLSASSDGHLGHFKVIQDSTGNSDNCKSVQLRNVNSVLHAITDDLQESETMILKIDCEGGEDAIFQAIDDTHFERISGILLEWHSEAIRQTIQCKLHNLGITTLTRRFSEQIGMLYAFPGRSLK